ncbi:hypothetical protein R3X27_05130 [Tropicimonas sp. TH_r6]|uniref:hypothetical protein n=1 Tax=Tropicimonas sp. TH_r6 TaxID=3082085 RepID=UPI002955DC80|nr:hypothetical protein [Tropicimonas sp. TH_r6]MDV7142060.1 hypothetical protein [Tropicimonas sp. TH_r6]
MNTRPLALAAAMLSILGACTEMPVEDGGGPLPGFVDLPENVVALAAPSQDLNRVRVAPEDGCYWYQWTGPVETTFLPLRSRDGRPICTVSQDAAAPQS